MDALVEQWDFTFFAIMQEIDGIADRQAVGAEARYRGERTSIVGVVDVDLSYGILNSALVTANWRATEKLKSLLETDPPYGSKVSFTPDWRAPGWHAPPMAPWLEEAVDRASRSYFGAPAMHMGEGATIPFMGMLGEKFPDAQFLITGVLGPGANAHGPNEFLHVPTAEKLTACVAEVIARHHAATQKG